MGPDGIRLDNPVHVNVELSPLAEGEKVGRLVIEYRPLY